MTQRRDPLSTLAPKLLAALEAFVLAFETDKAWFGPEVDQARAVIAEAKSQKCFEDVAEALGHQLRRDEDGGVDMFALAFEHCNGPACVKCGASWCVHCTPKKDIKPCRGA